MVPLHQWSKDQQANVLADQEETPENEFNDQWRAKRQEIISNQSVYDEKMIQETNKKQVAKKSFKIGDKISALQGWK